MPVLQPAGNGPPPPWLPFAQLIQRRARIEYLMPVIPAHAHRLEAPFSDVSLWVLSVEHEGDCLLGVGETIVDAFFHPTELVYDGRECPTCGRPTAVDVEGLAPIDEDLFCTITISPAAGTFHRACGGEIT